MEVKQLSPNQILVVYDRRTDLASATNVSNYWIRSNIEHPIPPAVATEGMNLALTKANALRPDMAAIRPVDNSNMRFFMTFKVNVIPGLMYIVLPCFVNVEGWAGFDGPNWGPFSKNMFIAV